MNNTESTPTRRDELVEILRDAREAARNLNGLNLSMLDRRLVDDLEAERLITVFDDSAFFPHIVITERGKAWLRFAEDGVADPDDAVRELEARWSE